MCGYLLLLPVLFPVLAGVLMYIIKPFKTSDRLVNIYSVAVLCVSTVITVTVAFAGTEALTLFRVTDNIMLVLKGDNLTKLFATLMSVVFTLVGLYATDYMKHEKDVRRFFAFYLMVFGVLNGIYMSANLITMYLFYEMMTLLSLPLVLHSLTKEAIAAGFKYLYYSIGGAFLSLVSIFFIYRFADTYEFTPGGFISSAAVGDDKGLLLTFTFLAIIGFGCKAGLFPLHDWLPVAHPVAPAPASAVLSGIITKSGVIAIIRLVFYSVGADMIRGTWVQYAWMILALVTVFLGSMMAYLEKILKKRLAYSTVSQVSYVLFGLSLLHPVGFMGALLHVIFHSVIKDDLFLVSGVIIHNTGATTVDELKGIGRRMPVTIWCFTIASLALIGIPPCSGFVSKWFLASGALAGDFGAFRILGPVILLISALLTAGYLLPVTIDGFFPGKDAQKISLEPAEPKASSLIPIIIFGALSLLLGLFPGILESGIEVIVSELML